MSDTKRRKNQRPTKAWFTSEHEFNDARRRHELAPTKPAVTIAHPNIRLDEDKTGQWQAYYNQFKSDEWQLYNDGRWFPKFNYGKRDYKSYKRAIKARFHSDIGVGSKWYKSAPKWYVRLFINKPLRQKHREELYRGVVLDEECEVVLTPNKKCSSMYW